MKIQELAIIFIIIILPISLLLSEYTQFQIQTLKIQTEYDAKLTAATYDAIKAFQLNASNSSTSDLSNSKMRDLEASVNSFRNSIISGFKLNGYTASELDNYIPALVYTLYDGFYIYSPYENTNYRYKTDGNGNPIISQPIDGNGEKIYGLKPYINYSCRYINGNIDVVITYALDNYITVQGKIGDEYVNKSGYLIDNITVIGDNVTYNGVTIQNETLKEDIGGVSYNYAKINGVKYYLVGDQIVYILNGTPVTQYRDGDTNYLYWKNLILNNDSAKQYYIEANQFTTWFKSTGLINLAFKDAVDEVIDKETGATSITNIWPSNNELIFNDNSCNIENELSNFNQHRLGIIRHKIETNLAIAIANYNSYSGATTNVFQMPELKENEWDHITHNISLISFLQGLPIGGKTYNGYSLVTNSESEEVVLEQNIYILGYNTANGQYNYHKIGDKGLETGGTVAVNVGPYAKEALSAGRLNLDFERKTVVSTDNTVTYYYYPLSKYNASYDSVVMQENVTTYNDIYEYVNGQSTALKTAFYTALGRERMSKYNSNNIVSAVNVPYIPTGFTLVLGTDFDTGIVIQDRYGNQFVWVEVPKTDAVYRTAGLNITAFTNEEYNKIENDLHTYTSTYRKRTAYKDEYYSTETTGLNQTEYNTLKKNMLKNIYKYGGFYVGRYETGIANSYRTAASKSTIAEKPVIKKNAYPYNYVSTSQAQQLANSFAPTGYTSNLLFGVQYDLMLKYLENKGTTTNEIMSNSSSWGNYSNSTYRITNTTAKYYLSGIWSATPYNHSDGSKVLLTTGASEKFSRQNIFDIGGNVYEWTLEYSSYTGSPCANRGGNYMYPGSSYYAGSRGSGTITQSNELAGFRVALYKDEEIEQKCYITYNANGGVFSNSNTTKQQETTYGSTIFVVTENPSKTGYTFKGWAESATSNTVQYQTGDIITIRGNKTLYAVWEENVVTYIVRFNANGGTGGPTAQTKRKGVNLVLPLTEPIRNGYTFLGWATSPTALMVTYFPGGTYTTDSNVTLYAIWKANTIGIVTVTFNLNGGTGNFTSIAARAGTTVTLHTNVPTKAGYTFVGWLNPSENALFETIVQPGAQIVVNSNITLTAKWTTSGAVTM